MKSGCDGLLGGGPGTYFLAAHGSELIAIKEAVDRTLVGLEVG